MTVSLLLFEILDNSFSYKTIRKTDVNWIIDTSKFMYSSNDEFTVILQIFGTFYLIFIWIPVAIFVSYIADQKAITFLFGF